MKDILARWDELPADLRSAAWLRDAADGDAVLLAELESLLAAGGATHRLVAGVDDAARSALASAASASAIPSGTPLRIGPYDVLGTLGSGGMAVVYRALQTQPFRREVALKVLHRSADLAGISSRFEAERQVLALMDHPNIARVYDAGVDDFGRSWFAMELVDGVPINRYVRERSLSVEAVLDLILSVCRAVQHAHQKGIIHRDLKPSNLLISESDGRPLVKVIDFGIAKALGGGTALETFGTLEGQLLGTLEYMSPEQARGRPGEVDTRTDVFSIGVVLHELLLGRPPRQFGGKSLTEIIDSLTRDPLPPLTRAMNGGRRFDPDLETILAKALDMDPTRRYDGPGALADDIERLRRGEPILARPPSTGYQLRKLVQRHRGAVAAATAAFLGLAGFSVVLAVLLAGQARERKRAESAAGRAEAVSGFLEEMIQSASMNDAGHDVRVRDVVEREIREFSGTLTEQPEARASLALTLARTAASLELTSADSMLQAAVELQRTTHGEWSKEYADALSTLGTEYQKRWQPERADSVFVRAVEVSYRANGADHPRTGSVLGQWTGTLAHLKRFAAAESAGHLALAILEPRDKSLAQERAATLGNLAFAGIQVRNWVAAEKYAREGVEVASRWMGEEHVLTMQISQHHAAALVELNRRSEAVPVMRRVVSSLTRMAGPTHQATIIATNQLALVLMREWKFAEAESLTAWCLWNWPAEGTFKVGRVILLNNLGYVSGCLGKYEQARACLESARVMAMEHEPPMIPQAMDSRAHQALIALAEDRLDVAGMNFEDWRKLLPRSLSPGAPTPPGQAVPVVRYLNAAGMADSARNLAQRNLAIDLEDGRTDLWDLVVCGACAAAGCGMKSEADSLLRLAKPVLESTRYWPLQARFDTECVLRIYESWGDESEAAFYRELLDRLNAVSRAGREASTVESVDALIASFSRAPAAATAAHTTSRP